MKLMSRNEAIQQGSIRYYTGKPCVHGHIAQRNTITGACLQCMGDYNRKRRRKDTDRVAVQKGLQMVEWAITTRQDDIPRIKRVVEFLNNCRLTPGSEELIRIMDEFIRPVVDSL